MKTIEEIRSAFATLRERVAELERRQPCGHSYFDRNRSVETGIEFCDACRTSDMFRDALTSETTLRATVAGEPARIAAAREEQREQDKVGVLALIRRLRAEFNSADTYRASLVLDVAENAINRDEHHAPHRHAAGRSNSWYTGALYLRR